MASPMHSTKQIIYMPMLIIKSFIQYSFTLLFLIASIPLCFAGSLFSEQFQIEPNINTKLADRITQYHSDNILLSIEQQKVELLKLDQQLDALQSKHSRQASYWFIRGLNYKNLAAHYFETNNTQLVKSYIKNKNSAYKKTIELNDTDKNKLSAAIFSTMKPGLSENLKIKATKKEIALGGNGDNDSYYWFLHWSNIEQLEKSGRKDEAKAAYKQMQKELKNSSMDMSVYNSLTEKIEIDTLKLTDKKNQSKNNPPKKDKPKQEEEFSPEKYDTKIIIISSIAVLSVLSLILVIIYELKRKQKKLNTKY